MKENNPKNINKMSNQFINKLGADKKKLISAICLLAIMAFMWIRVLGGNDTKDADAEILALQNQDMTDTSKDEKIEFVELPVVNGRNDELSRDFFTANEKTTANYGDVNVVTPDVNEDYMDGVKKKLKLEAISMGQKPQAFINGKLLSQGGKLKIQDGEKSYEFEVMKIEDKKVVMRCSDVEVVLSLSQAKEIENKQ